MFTKCHTMVLYMTGVNVSIAEDKSILSTAIRPSLLSFWLPNNLFPFTGIKSKHVSVQQLVEGTTATALLLM